MKKTITILLHLVFFSLVIISGCKIEEDVYITQLFKTDGRIHGHPALEEGVIYFGSNDSTLYAFDLQHEKLKWKFKAEGSVQSEPLIFSNSVFFSSGSSFYCLNKTDGKLNWQQTADTTYGEDQLDPWDYHHGSAIVFSDQIIFGSRDGHIYALDQSNGEVKLRYKTIEGAPVRSTPVIAGRTMYFGDWNGRIYAFDLEKRDTLWTLRTYEKQPYPTFGQLNTRPILGDSILLFGCRNPEIQAINIEKASVAWNHKEVDGGWISGDPLLYEDKVFIAGSDCHKLLVFNVHDGTLYWSQEFLYNNFSKPVIYKDLVLVTTGDAYSYAGENTGRGYLFAIDKSNGAIVNFSLIGGNCMSNPKLYKDKLIFGSDDGHLYAVDLLSFVADSVSLMNRGYAAFDDIQIEPNPFQDSVSISCKVQYQSPMIIKILDLQFNELAILHQDTAEKGTLSVNWNGRDHEGKSLASAYYILEIGSGEYFKNAFIQRNNPAEMENQIN